MLRYRVKLSKDIGEIVLARWRNQRQRWRFEKVQPGTNTRAGVWAQESELPCS
jgi:hypothetical protein